MVDREESVSAGKEIESSPGTINHPIVVRDGIEFYAVTRYGNKGEWVEYMPVHGPNMGNGTYDSFATSVGQAKQALAREAAVQRKEQRREAYEDAVNDLLSDVAKLQKKIVSIGLGKEEASREDLEKMRLAVQTSEQVLNRALGRPVSRIEADVNHSVSDQMMTIDADWVVEE